MERLQMANDFCSWCASSWLIPCWHTWNTYIYIYHISGRLAQFHEKTNSSNPNHKTFFYCTFCVNGIHDNVVLRRFASIASSFYNALLRRMHILPVNVFGFSFVFFLVCVCVGVDFFSLAPVHRSLVCLRSSSASFAMMARSSFWKWYKLWNAHKHTMAQAYMCPRRCLCCLHVCVCVYIYGTHLHVWHLCFTTTLQQQRLTIPFISTGVCVVPIFLVCRSVRSHSIGLRKYRGTCCTVFFPIWQQCSVEPTKTIETASIAMKWQMHCHCSIAYVYRCLFSLNWLLSAHNACTVSVHRVSVR